MTLADIDAQHANAISIIRRYLRAILDEAEAPLGLDTIEAHLQKRRLDKGELKGPLSTFDVRDAIAEMVDDGEARFTVGRKLERVKP